MVVQCDLYSEDGNQSCNLVYNPSRLPESFQSVGPSNASSVMAVRPLHEPTPLRNMTGSTVANASQLLDSNNKPGIFFVFPDISVRTEGRYIFKFVLIDLSEGYSFLSYLLMYMFLWYISNLKMPLSENHLP